MLRLSFLLHVHAPVQVENEEAMQVDDPANNLEENIPESFIVENPIFVSM